MKSSRGCFAYLFAGWTLAIVAVPARPDILPAAIFADHMVLQRQMPIPVWGIAEPGEKVRVQLDKQDVSTTADKDGRWTVKLQPMEAGGPYELTVDGKNRVAVKDVLLGEVWICSGQSNMAFDMNSSTDGRAVAAKSANDNIRLFMIPFRNSPKKLADFRDGEPLPADRREMYEKWRHCGPKTTGNFSAVGYYFGRDLQNSLKVPVGLIHAAVGATSLQYWVDAVEDTAHKIRFDRSGVCYNSVIAPLQPFAFRGVLWYQGEANSGQGFVYRYQLPLLIKTWRSAWGQGDFPFLIAQLHQYRSHPGLPEIRESQWVASRAVPKCGLIVTADHDDIGSAHPRDKKPIGERFAIAARALVYGHKIVHSGPTYSAMKIEGAKVTLDFEHVGGGLVVKGDSLAEFTIAGEDGKFMPAIAEIRGRQVIITSPEVARPVAVRYAWSPTPRLSLYNRDGLPAVPFRTDDFPLPSQPRPKP